MRILIVKMSSLGDIVHAFPVLEYLKTCQPQSQIDWVVEHPFAALVRAHPMIHRVITVQTKKWRSHLFDLSTWKEIAECRHELQKTAYDLVLDLQGNSKSGLVTAITTSKKKVGFDYSSVPEWPNLLATRKRFSPPSGKNIREDYLFLAQSALGCFSGQSSHISHKLSKKSDEMLCEIHRESARDHYQIDKARRVIDEDRMTDRSSLARVGGKCGLTHEKVKLHLSEEDQMQLERVLAQIGPPHGVARISHKISEKSDDQLCEIHRKDLREHCQIEKGKAFLQQDGAIDFLNWPIISEKYVLKVLVCSGSNWANKQLSQETLKDFLQIFSENLNVHFLLGWGNQHEKITAEEIQSALPQNCSILDRLSLPALQNLMTKIDLVVAMDSLPLHLAAISSTPTYSIFGPSSAKKYKPVGKNHEAFQGSCPYGKIFEKRCDILRSCKTGACMKQLQGEEIFRHFQAWWLSLKTGS